jgi:hypothetical protein
MSNENSNPYEGPTPELGPVDKLIEASLDEWLGNSRSRPNPQDLIQRIAQRSEKSIFSGQELDQSVRNAGRDVQAIARSRYEPPKRRTYSWSAIAAIAASIGAVSLIGWWSISTNSHTDTHQIARMDTSSVDSKLADTPQYVESSQELLEVSGAQEPSLAQSTVEAHVDDSHRDDSRRVDLKIGPEGVLGETLPRVDLTQQALEPRGSQIQVSEDRGFKTGGDLDRQVISVIDSQFHQVWKQLGLLDETSNNTGLTTERIVGLLLHRPPTTTELESFRREKFADKPVTGKHDTETLVQPWLFGDEFNRVWADRLVEFYTGGKPLDNDHQLALRNWLEELIRQDLPLQEIQKKLVHGLGQSDHPAYILRDHWLQFAGQSDPTNLSWVGMNSAEQQQLRGLTQLFLRLTGNISVACTQCHTNQTREYPIWLAGRLPKAADIPGAQAVAFDSVAAIVIRWSQPGRSELFSKEQDNRISKVLGRSPDGRRFSAETTNDQIIESWLGQGSHDQRELVKWIWKDFFGEALASEFGLGSEVAYQERQDLIDYLGKQVVEQKAGVRQFVYWLLMSEIARQTEKTLSYAQYLAMDTENLKDYSVRRSVFKSLMNPTVRSGTNKPRSIQQYARTLFPERPDWLEHSLLAQPSSQRGAPPPELDPSSNPRPNHQESWGPDILKAELDYRTAGEQSQTWGRLLCESTLSDNQIVEHAYLISKHRFPTNEELKAWNASSWSKSDRATAVLRLMAAIANGD